MGAVPCSTGPSIVKPPSASSVERIRSARSATSFAGITDPRTVSVTVSWARWAGL